jgi:hypothetical protein
VEENLTGAGCSGMGAVVKVGLWERRTVSCSLYETGGCVWLQLNDRRNCLSDGSIEARRRFIAPYVRRFTLLHRDSSQPEVDYIYWLRGRWDPWEHSIDFFEYVVRSTRDVQALAEFVCRWQARAESTGDITEEEVAAVQECVQKRMATGD